jgi:HSP20 family protein
MRMEKMNVPVKAEAMRPGFRPLALFDEMLSDFEPLWQRPWAPLFPTTMNRLRRFGEETMTWMPKLDVYEEKDHLVVKADLPGMKKEDVHLAIDEGDLVIEGERKEEKKVEKESYYKAECNYGAFYRRLPLSFDVKAEDITAKFANGVLEIHMPKPIEIEKKLQEVAIH